MKRRLSRSRAHAVLGGVAAGVAIYLGIDTAAVRLIWIVLTPLTGGIAFLAYLVAWVILPTEAATGLEQSVAAGAIQNPVIQSPDDGAASPASGVSPSRPLGVGCGAFLIVLGTWFLLREYLPEIDWGATSPFIVLGLGVLIILASIGRR